MGMNLNCDVVVELKSGGEPNEENESRQLCARMPSVLFGFDVRFWVLFRRQASAF